MVDVFAPYVTFFSNFLIYYMYCGGVPLMYLLGFLFFAIGYWIYKYLFIDFHRKSWNFSEEIPFYALSIMKFGLLVHLAMICFMYTNKRLLSPSLYTPVDFFRPRAESPNIFFKRRYDSVAA